MRVGVRDTSSEPPRLSCLRTRMGLLNALRTQDGFNWSCEFHHADILMCLGMAVGKVEILTFPITWHLLPAGMPFYRIVA